MTKLTDMAAQVSEEFSKLDINNDQQVDFKEFSALEASTLSPDEKESIFQEIILAHNDNPGPETAITRNDIKAVVIEYLAEPMLGGAPLGLSRSHKLIERRAPNLSDEEYQNELKKIEEVAMKPIPAKFVEKDITFPALGRILSVGEGSAVHHSFKAISQKRLNKMKDAIRTASGYDGDIYLNLPTRNAPKQDYQHLIMEDTDGQQIGVVKFTEPVSIKFIPSVR